MLIAKNNIFDLPKELATSDSAGVIVVSFGFEKSVTFGGGTKRGPEAIISASHQVELFDEELWQETYKKVAIATVAPVKPEKNISDAKKQITKIIGDILRLKRLPITLGGEHSITPFIIEEYKKHFGDFSILQFDAHADLRDGYLGQKYSHAAAMRRCLDLPGINLVQIGIRSISNENDELAFWKRSQARIKTFWAKDKVCEKRKIHTNCAHANLRIKEIIKNLKDEVYLTFDVDAFDSSIMPSTGTPEPGGLDWYEVLDILRAVAKNKKIIGADFVELSPIKNLPAPDFLVAKLIYKFIGYTFIK